MRRKLISTILRTTVESSMTAYSIHPTIPPSSLFYLAVSLPLKSDKVARDEYSTGEWEPLVMLGVSLPHCSLLSRWLEMVAQGVGLSDTPA